MSEHTPGPWKVSDRRSSFRPDLPKLVEVYGLEIEAEHRTVAAADVWSVEDEHDAECMANARLIAAAPDLLASLEAILWATVHPEEEWDGLFATGRDAIAKARGIESHA